MFLAYRYDGDVTRTKRFPTSCEEQRFTRPGRSGWLDVDGHGHPFEQDRVAIGGWEERVRPVRVATSR